MRILIISIFTFIFAITSYSHLLKYGNDDKKWENVNWSNVRFFKGPKGTLSASLAENEYNEKLSDKVLVLHFNDKSEIKQGKEIKQFVVEKATATIDNTRKYFGNGSALFYRFNDTLIYRLNEPNFFERYIDTGPFTFEFLLHPFSRNDNEIIFQKYSPVYKNGKVEYYSGIRVYFKKGMLIWEFINIFKDFNNKDRRSIVKISSKQTIELHKWNHHALTYDQINGKLTYYINGNPVNSIFCTNTGEADATVLAAGFDSREYGMLVIGKGYQGLIDEFTISAKTKHNFRINKYVSEQGLIRSGIIDLQSTGTVMEFARIDYDTAQGADVILEYRISNVYFNADQPETIFPWREYNTNNETQNQLVRGRFFQWRIKIIGTENGKYSPVINSITYKFSADKRPFKPIGLIALSYNGNVYLKWQGNTESDVVGYKIYYGNARGVYNGTLAMEGFSPIQLPISSVTDPVNPEFILTGLTINELYYITITAYDKSGQESPFAGEIYVRVKRFKHQTHRGIFERGTE